MNEPGGDVEWLGLRAVGEGRWELDVTPGVVAGSGALYGGWATATVLAVGRTLCAHRPRWVSAHFTGLARLGDTVSLTATVVSAGRTVTHLAVEATTGGSDERRATYSARATFGDRPAVAEAAGPPPPAVPPAAEAEPFDLPVHEGTFADRLEWRLAPVSGSPRPVACWWVRPQTGPDGGSPGLEVTAAVLADYLTYGIGRAASTQVGGLSVDNGLRLHRHGPRHGWLLLEAAADSLDGGFGSGTARIFDEEGRLVATGSQTMVLNSWDWRRPGELGREDPSAAPPAEAADAPPPRP